MDFVTKGHIGEDLFYVYAVPNRACADNNKIHTLLDIDYSAGSMKEGQGGLVACGARRLMRYNGLVGLEAL